MSEAKQLTDNEVIAVFMGGTRGSELECTADLWYFGDPENPIKYLKYDTSWDRLLPACHKFDNLDLTVKTSRSTYCDHCDAIDNAVVTYDIAPAYRALVAAIRWYNSTLNPDKP